MSEARRDESATPQHRAGQGVPGPAAGHRRPRPERRRSAGGRPIVIALVAFIDRVEFNLVAGALPPIQDHFGFGDTLAGRDPDRGGGRGRASCCCPAGRLADTGRAYDDHRRGRAGLGRLFRAAAAWRRRSRSSSSSGSCSAPRASSTTRRPPACSPTTTPAAAAARRTAWSGPATTWACPSASPSAARSPRPSAGARCSSSSRSPARWWRSWSSPSGSRCAASATGSTSCAAAPTP